MLQRGFLELANGKNLGAPSQPWGSEQGLSIECAELPGGMGLGWFDWGPSDGLCPWGQMTA